MSNRTLRINELIQRELNDILHRHHQSESVAVTITEVRIAPDLRDARVFVSVIGNEAFAEEKLAWLRRVDGPLRAELARRIVLKFMPRLTYVLDQTAARSGRVLQMLDELDAKEKTKNG